MSMTENEIKIKLEVLKDWVGNVSLTRQYMQNVIDEAIQALKEIQQYRAIGTVERFEQLSKQFAPHNVDETSCHLRQCNKCDMYRKENEKYHAIGTIEEFKALKEKSVAKEPLRVPTDDSCVYYEFRCPSCGEWLSYEIKRRHCRCGQKLDWQ